MGTGRILIADGDTQFSALVKGHLEREGHQVRVVATASAAAAEVNEWHPDLAVADPMIPGSDGWRLLELIRGIHRRIALIVLSSGKGETDRVSAFRMGADHYLTKPLSIRELLARVSSVLRRYAAANRPQLTGAVAYGDFCIDFDARTVTHTGIGVTLSPKAFDLLCALIRGNRAALTRAELLRDVWGYAPDVATRTVDSHVSELRRKLDDPAHPRHFLTIPKFGYRFVP